MLRVGLVGEDPNDTTAIQNLLHPQYKGKVQFLPLIKRIRGHALDTKKVKDILKLEFAEKKCDFVLYIRDLDGLESNKDKVVAKKKWFSDLDSFLNKKGIFLLNIWELEAIILADIQNFNKQYGINYNFKGNPTFQEKPKEKLMSVTFGCKKRYTESHCPDIFKKLDIETIKNNLKYFKDFVSTFEKKISE